MARPILMIWFLLLLITLSMRILKYTTSLILLIGSANIQAQESKKNFVPSEVIFAVDAIGLGKTIFSDETKLEFHSKIDFGQFYLAGEFGVDKINPTGERV